MIDNVLLAILNIAGKDEPTKLVFFKAGLVTKVIGLLSTCDAKDVAIRVINFISRLVKLNESGGSGNAPETMELLNKLKELSESNTSSPLNSADVKSECTKALARITGKPSNPSKSTR